MNDWRSQAGQDSLGRGSSGFLLPPRGSPGNAQTLLPYAWSQWGQWWDAVVTCVTLLTTGRWWVKLQPGRGGGVLLEPVAGFQTENQHMFRGTASVSSSAVTNYHKRRGLKQRTFILLQFWRSEVWNGSHGANVKVTAGLRSFCRLEGRICSLPFAALKGCCLPWLADPSSSGIIPTSASIITSPSLTRKTSASTSLLQGPL